MPAVPVAARKREIRAQLLADRRRLPEAVRQDAARRVQATITATLAAAVAGRGGQTVAGYLPMATEPGGPDLPAVLARTLGSAGRLLLPVLREDRDLDWVAYDDPGQRWLGQAAIREASLLVVPAVAVDPDGVRLGRGGGSYDRVLARIPAGTEVVALLHDGELRTEPLPADPHDRPVTAVVTPTLGLVRLPLGT